MTVRKRTLRSSTVRDTVIGSLRDSRIPTVLPINAIRDRAGFAIKDRAGNVILERTVP